MATEAIFYKALEHLRQLHQAPNDADWTPRWQFVCESVWEALSFGATLSAYDFGIFTALLSQRQHFDTAAMVLPVLRKQSEEEQLPESFGNTQQADIYRSTTKLRAEKRAEQNLKQADYDDTLFKAEKQAFFDSEMHRAKVFLGRDGILGEKARDIEEWLEAGPSQDEK